MSLECERLSSASAPAATPTGARPSRSPVRVPILAIVLVVAACAIAFTALRTASRPWHDATYTFTVFLLLIAVLASRYRRGGERAFWFGFAVFGWGFFLLGYVPWISPFGGLGPASSRPLNPNLLTSRVTLFLLPYLRTSTNSLGAIDPITWATLGIVHQIMTLVIGAVGGLIALLLRRRSRSRISLKLMATLAGMTLAAAVAISIESTPRPTVPFFPPDLFREDRESEAWYSKQLAAMGEPSLSLLSRIAPGATVYRLLWLPTFRHPVCVRIERADDGGRLDAMVLDGQGGYDPGGVAIERSLRVDVEQWNRLEQLVGEAAFWESRTWSDDGSVVEDGDQFVIEGTRAGTYRLLDTAELDRDQRRLCRYMLRLTGIDVSAQWEESDPGRSSDDSE